MLCKNAIYYVACTPFHFSPSYALFHVQIVLKLPHTRSLHLLIHVLLFINTNSISQYLEKYPHEAPLVELSSPSLPPQLLRNKEKECVEKAKEHLGSSQVKFIYEIIYNFIQTNLFIPCWREMKQVAALSEGKGVLGE